jgi:hypothetical protein
MLGEKAKTNHERIAALAGEEPNRGAGVTAPVSPGRGKIGAAKIR